MNVYSYLEKMKKIQTTLLDFIENEDNNEEKYENLKRLLDEYKIHEDSHDIKLILHLIVQISNDHYRNENFFLKIEKILNIFKKDMSQYFTNSELFEIFDSNKRILLFLFEEKMMIMDEFIARRISKPIEYLRGRYAQYFAPESEQYLDKKWFTNQTIYYRKYFSLINKFLEAIPENFNEKRKKGENDEYVYELIRKDSIEDFIIHVNKTELNLNSTITPSIYETNNFLFKHYIELKIGNKYHETTLIEYAAFFGSIQIFKYLKFNGAILHPALWLYAIHGKNPEILNYLEIEINEPFQVKECKFDKSIVIEAIKCHDNDIVNYFENKFFENNKSSSEILIDCIQYYNFELINDELIDESVFIYLCEYDYYNLVKILLEEKNIDINKQIKKEPFPPEPIINDRRLPFVYYADPPGRTAEYYYYGGRKRGMWSIGNISKYFYYFNQFEYDQSICDFNKSALYSAVEKGNVEIVKLLLTNDKIDVNIKYQYNDEEKTVFYLAVEKENIEIIKLLLSNSKVDVNIPYLKNDFQNIKWGEREERTPLYLAVENENVEIVKQLIMNDKIEINAQYKHYTYFNCDTAEKEEKTPLYRAVEKENVELVKLLLSNSSIDVNIINKQYYIYNSEGKFVGDFEFDEKNFCTGEGVVGEENAALHIAVLKGNIEIINLLLENKNIDVNLFNKMIYEGNEKEWIYDPLEEIKNFEGGPIKEWPVPPKKEEKGEKTPLHLAVINGNLEVIKVLLNYKNININLKDDKGKKPIDYADNDVIKSLFNH